MIASGVRSSCDAFAANRRCSATWASSRASMASAGTPPEHQRRLFHEAVLRYGSPEEAARWVATLETSAHVRGEAVDVGPAEAMAWLVAHGAAYGLCRVYDNEPWHYELRAGAGGGCPPVYADATEDPRMR
nr:hypothetical protein [Miltoncostaea marina]